MTKQEEILLRKKAMDWGYDANKTNQFIEFAKQKQEITKTPIQQEQPQQDGILKSIIKDPVKELLVRPAVRATQLGIAGIGGGIGALTGNEKLKNRALDYSQQEQNVSLPLLGNFNIPGQKTGMSGAKQVVGDALKSASYLYTPGAAAGTVRAGLGGAVKTAAIQGAKGGAIGLGAYQAGQAMQDDKSLGQVAYEGLKGAAIGGVTGGVLGGGIGAATYGVQKGIGMVTKAGDKLKDKATSDLEGKYNEIFTGTKAGTKKLDKSLSRGKDPAKFLAEHGYIVDVENGKVMSTGLVDRMKQDVQPLEDVLDEILKAKDAKMATSQRINLSKLAAQVKRSLTTDFNKASGDLSKMYAMVDDVIGELRTQYGDDVGLSALNQIKRGQWGQTGFDLTKPKYSSEVSYKIGSAAKKAIEDAVSEADIKQLNSYIGDYFNSITLLNQVNGNAIKGGRLGKYFARTIGAAAGAKAGPIGSLAGAITGDTIANIMQNNYISNPIKRMLLQRIMRQTGVSSPIYQAAQEALKELTRIPLLPAGGGVNQAGRVINNNPINLPSKLPNYGDEAAFKGKGALSK